MKTKRTLQIYLLVLLWLVGPASAAIWYVDSDAPLGGDGTSWATAYRSIQQAINSASPFWQVCFSPTDHIYVKSGTYTLASELTLGKTVIMYGGFPNSMANPTMSNRNPSIYPTIIDGNNVTRCLTVTSYNVIDGFTFQDGYSTLNAGAIFLDEVPTYNCPLGLVLSVTIRNCRFIDNYAGVHGGAIYDLRSDAKIQDCTFDGNTADNGGAIKQWETSSIIESCVFNNNSSTTPSFGGGAILGDYQVYGSITNCLFTNNTSTTYGGAISYHQGWPTITNCTFVGNTATTDGGAIYCNTASPVLKNCILWDNSDDEIANYFSSPGATATYSCIQGGFPGTGNIPDDPSFVGGGDYHLDDDSLCRDAGTNSSAPSDDLDGNARPQDSDGNGSAITDMGCYEHEYVNVDLRVTWIDYTPDIARVGEPVTIEVTVRNFGETDAGPFWVDWYANEPSTPGVGDFGQRFQSYSSLASSASLIMTKTWIYTTQQTNRTYAQVDSTGAVDETNETNNVYYRRLHSVDGELVPFDLKEDTSNASMWFGGDDRPGQVRNIGGGQSVNLPRAAIISSVGFNFGGPFDYYENPDGYGHEVVLDLYPRRADGTALLGTAKLIPASFNGGWIDFNLGNLIMLDADSDYIFTCHLRDGEINQLKSSILGRSDDPWPTCNGYYANVSGTPANMSYWPNWSTHSWDFNLSLTGWYIEKYPGDVNQDRSVDVGDVVYLASEWVRDDCIMPGFCGWKDVNWNKTVELNDYSLIAANYGRTWYSYDDLNRAAIYSLRGLLTSGTIDCSDSTSPKPLDAGSVVIYLTDMGRYGKFAVENFDQADMNKLTIKWTTYNSNGTVFSSGTGLVIRGTYLCGLDSGREFSTTGMGEDFWWNIFSSTTRSIVPQNGATFHVLYPTP